MTRLFSISETLTASGGATPSFASEAKEVDSESAVLQVENLASAASTDVDFHLEVRMSDSLSWQDWITPYSGIANGVGDIDPIDVESLAEVRIRIVNNDTSNGADVAAELETR